MAGVGMTPEAIEHNPVVYDLMVRKLITHTHTHTHTLTLSLSHTHTHTRVHTHTHIQHYPLG